MPSSPPIVYPELPESTSALPPVSGSQVSTRSHPDLSVLKRRLESAVLCNQTMRQKCSEPNCPTHRHHRQRPLYSSAFTHSNPIISAIKPPQLSYHERRLYEVYNNATDEEEDHLPPLKRVQDERDVAQATTELKGMWREQMIKGYRQDLVWKLANDSTATARGGKAQHYSSGNGLLYATTRGGEKCLYIPKGHATNCETLKELAISEIHNKGHHSAQRNLRYATAYLFWPEIRKDFRDFAAQCEQCQISQERSTLPSGDALMLPLPSQIFTSYAIDFMGPLTKAKSYDTVLVVVDRAVGYCWLIPTTTKATVIATMELQQNYVFTPHGVPTSIVSDADPGFTSWFWRQTLKTMGIEHIMAVPGHHQTNRQAERKIRQLKTALRTLINRRQTNWLISLPQLASYTNAGYSETIDMSPYKAGYGRNNPLLSTYQTAATSVPAAEEYFNRHNELRNSAYQALQLARVRSRRTATKRRTPRSPVSVGGEILVFGDMFSTESGRLKKLELRWCGPFTVLSYDYITQNYTFKMDARMYRRREAVFHC